MSSRAFQQLAPMRETRLRPSKHIPAVGDGSVPYALLREENRGQTPARVTAQILGSDAWLEVVAPELEVVQRRRERPGKERPWYTAHELAGFYLFQRVAGVPTFQAARELLAGDTIDAHLARRELGLNRPRQPQRKRGRRGGLPAKATEQRSGIPSKATMTRFLRDWPEAERAETFERLFKRFRSEHLEFPEFREECLTLYGDGSPLLTHYTAPKYKKTGELANEKRVTAPEAGYVGQDAGPDKSGHGWNLITLVNRASVPVSYTLTRLPEPECDRLMDAQEEFAHEIRPHLDSTRLGIITTDGAFHKPEARARWRDCNFIENQHLCSHADREDVKLRAERLSNERIPIEDYPNWFANGHREVICRCGRRAAKDIRPASRPGARPTVRVEGKCPVCGPCSITSGDFRRGQNPTRFVRCHPNEPTDKRDWALGNGLTYNDPEAALHGRKRFGRNEGFHGALVTRYGLLEKRWFRRRDQARIEVALVFSIAHAMSIEYRKRVGQSQGPPVQVLAA